MPDKIILETHAYNASSTLERTVKSVLAQTYANWEWHLYENASTDNGATLDIITKYAGIDSRIKPHQNVVNIPRNTYLFLASRAVLAEHKDDYFTYICADDTWEPEFFEKMLRFQQEHNLDIASCTSRHINAETGECLNKFFLQENVFATAPDEFSDKFSILYSFYRDLWGHLIPFSTLQKLSYFNYMSAFNEDRYSFLKLNFQLLQAVDRIGILAEPLHNYYLSKLGAGQVSGTALRMHRLEHFKNICDILRSFLITKCGYISRANEKFILERYLKTVYDYLPVVFRNSDDIMKLLFIRNIIKLESTGEAFESPLVSGELKAGFADEILNWLRGSMQSGALKKPFVVGDEAGHFQYFLVSGSLNDYNYSLYDTYGVGNNRGRLGGIVDSALAVVSELERFFGKYSMGCR